MARTKQFNEQEVLERAKNLFWKQGFHATSVQDLVDHLGINRASLYVTFEGKNALYESALKTCKQQNGQVVQNLCTDSCSPLESIRQLFKSIISNNLSDRNKKGCFIVNCTTKYLPLNESLLPELLENQESFQATMEKMLNHSEELGEITKDTDVDAAAYLFTFLNGLQVQSKINSNNAQLEKLVDIPINGLAETNL